MAKKLALGKGMASLLGTNSNIGQPVSAEMIQKKVHEEVSSTGSLELAIEKIITNPNQPRKIFKEKELEELSLSIKENGVIQPLVVVKVEDGYELVAGERRLRASMKAGLKTVPVVIKNMTEREKMIVSIIENVQRSDLNCIEEALAYHHLMSEFNLTQEEVAIKLGKERSTIANFLRVLKLPRDVVEMVQKDLLSFGHAKVLASVKDRDHAIRFANEAVTKEMAVRELEKLVKNGKKNKMVTARNPFFDEKLDQLKSQLEKKTGFHFAINSKKSGAGLISLKYNNEAEFNDIYEYLLSK